jgi:integrase/recombinase XerD
MTIKIEKIFYDNQHHIGVHIHFSDAQNREKIKTIDSRLWHPQAKLWIVPYTEETYKQLQATFNEAWELVPSTPPRLIPAPFQPPKLERKEGFVAATQTQKTMENTAHFDQLNPKQQLAVSKLENLLILERKAYHTQKGYRNIFIQFLMYHKDTLPSLITADQIKAYIVMRIKDDTISKSTQNHIVSTLKAFYGRLLSQFDKVNDLYRPNKEEHLPKALSPEEITRLFAKVSNLKHRCILTLLFGSGLRVGEVVRLKWQDLDFVEKTVFIHNGKNYKDRYTILSEKSITLLQKYNAEPKPTDWVFESPDGGHYSERSVQQFFSDAMAKARIDKQVNTHSLRHAFATQLLKAHEDLDFVRKVMGHASIKTTQIYLHVIKEELTKTKSPLDNLDI